MGGAEASTLGDRGEGQGTGDGGGNRTGEGRLNYGALAQCHSERAAEESGGG